jgi:hypothetical protein
MRMHTKRSAARLSIRGQARGNSEHAAVAIHSRGAGERDMKSRYVGHACGVALVLAVGLCAPSALAQYYPHPYLEAECPDSSIGSYVTTQTSVTGYSGAGYLRRAGNITPPAYDDTSTERATYSFNLKGRGELRALAAGQYQQHCLRQSG